MGGVILQGRGSGKFPGDTSAERCGRVSHGKHSRQRKVLKCKALTQERPWCVPGTAGKSSRTHETEHPTEQILRNLQQRSLILVIASHVPCTVCLPIPHPVNPSYSVIPHCPFIPPAFYHHSLEISSLGEQVLVTNGYWGRVSFLQGCNLRGYWCSCRWSHTQAQADSTEQTWTQWVWISKAHEMRRKSGGEMGRD